MSEQQQNEPERTLDDVRNEYSKLCTHAGHLQYQLYTLTADLKLINDQLKSLNFEAGKLSEKAKEAPANE